MRLPDFVTGLELELRLVWVVYEHREVQNFAESVWALARHAPDPQRRAQAFLVPEVWPLLPAWAAALPWRRGRAAVPAACRAGASH